MVLADTSVWIDHLRRRSDRLADLLLDEEVVCHPFVIGELACGHLADRDTVLALLDRLPVLAPVSHAEARAFLDGNHLSGCGVGWVDVHLLAAARAARAVLWTHDRRLARMASRIGAAFE
jgi:predicted nucleic acid-binding protein